MSVNIYKHSENKLINVGGGSGSGTNERELTKAEYDALSEAEKNNGITCFIFRNPFYNLIYNFFLIS